jgi:hypothetical protein
VVWLLSLQFSEENIAIDEVHEGALAVDLDDGEPLAVLRFELFVAADVDLPELERHLGTDILEHTTGALAEVAALSVVERDLTDRCRA